jgi:hypothetical protein
MGACLIYAQAGRLAKFIGVEYPPQLRRTEDAENGIE